MKIVQSFWSKPMQTQSTDIEERFSGGWLDKKYLYMSWALSCLQFRKYFDNVELVTDAYGKEILIDTLKLPYTKVTVALDELNSYPQDLWALGKIYAYSIQKEPFIHDIEFKLATKNDELELGKVIAFGFYDEVEKTQKLGVFIQTRKKGDALLELATIANETISSIFGINISKIIPVKKIPKTTSGKVQRFVLEKQFLNNDFTDQIIQLDGTTPKANVTEATEEPQNPSRRLLPAVKNAWKQIIGLKEVDTSKTFFESGGSSLKASELAIKLSDEFDIQLPVEIVFEYSLISALTEEINRLINEKVTTDTSKEITTYEEFFPLSSAQKRLYYLYKNNPSSLAYNIPIVLSISGELDKEKVENTLKKIIQRHGTGTNIGDPIEIEALKTVYGMPERTQCYLGASKTNLGHLDVAAGMAGFIKTVMALHHKSIPPTLHLQTPNKKIQFEKTPFQINTQAIDWTTQQTPLRAGISAFGIGGTNAHIILEEAPKQITQAKTQETYTIQLSAKSSQSLQTIKKELSDYLMTNPKLSLGDIAFTLSKRAALPIRESYRCKSIEDLQKNLQKEIAPTIHPQKKKLVFMAQEHF